MQDHPALATVTLGYSPLVDAQRSVVGLRVSVVPLKPDAPVDAAGLLAALGQAWAPLPLKPAGSAVPNGIVVLNVAGEPLLRALLAAKPMPPFAIEVPTFLLGETGIEAAVQEMHRAGGLMWLKGRQVAELPAELRACFRHVIYDLPDVPPGGRGTLGAVAAGATRLAELDAAVKAGAVATAGWPLEDVGAASTASAAPKRKVAPETQVVLDLISRVDREEPIDKLEVALKGDPTLAFRLLRYLNSAAFGLTVEISSFRHALMILGYSKLKRWLALLLASASKNPAMKPVMAAAVRRGLLMEELVRGSGDAEMRGEMFICGVFSLLDRMLEQPFDELLKSVPVPERVRLALGAGEGPFAPYLELVRAVEQSDAYEVGQRAAAVLLSVGEVNRATLAALVAARQLD